LIHLISLAKNNVQKQRRQMMKVLQYLKYIKKKKCWKMMKKILHFKK
jgi:hypothetical protein